MKSVPTELADAIRSDYTLSAQPKLIALWNMNRFSKPTADNVPSEDTDSYDAEVFPIESIIEPLRPAKGIAKARIGEGVVSDYSLNAATRYYIGDVDDVYKYWTSPQPTNGSGDFPLHTDGQTVVRPFVLYDDGVAVNKIVMQSENYWGTAEVFTVYVKTTFGGAWTAVESNSDGALPNSGRLELWWNGTAWTRTPPADFIDPDLTNIYGIMFKVVSLTAGKDNDGSTTQWVVPTNSGYTTVNSSGNNAYFNLIELAAFRQADLTNRLISVEDTFDISEPSLLYPIGTLTSNEANISLSNYDEVGGVLVDGYFNRDNPDGVYYGLLEPNVEFRLSYVYDVDDVDYEVQQFVMYGDVWAGLITDTVTVELKDYSKFFDEIYPRAALYEDLTVPQIFQRVLDSVGYTNYIIDRRDTVVEHVIPVFWVTGEENIWEVLDDLAKGTQTGIYFDGFGNLQIKTRDAAFDETESPVWTLRGEDAAGVALADIISPEQDEASSVNHVTITYKATHWDSVGSNGVAALQKVWEPEGTVTLRATQLLQDLPGNGSRINISPQEIRYWPYSGLVQIQGEIIRYDGKVFAYYTGGTRNVVIVKSEDEYRKYNAKTASGLRHKNSFTGALVIPTVAGSPDDARGLWNSEQKAHGVEANGYSVRSVHYTSGAPVTDSTAKGFQQIKSQSKVRLSGGAKAGSNHVTLATRGAAVDTGYYMYGTRFNFVKQKGLQQFGGIVINNSNAVGKEDGYYIEVRPTSKFGAAERKVGNEVLVYSRKGNAMHLYDKGFATAIAEGLEYELDVGYQDGGAGSDIITVWLNGQMVVQTHASTNKNAWNGKFGMYVRGHSKIEYEYLYGMARPGEEQADDSTFFNLKEGGFTGGFWDREWVYKWRTKTRRVKKKTYKYKQRFNRMFFDEFGPYVHEVREFDVKFDPNPVQHSRLYMSNTWAVICTEYRSTPFGAHFVLANASRNNAVVNGDETLRFANEGAGNRVLTAIGRVLVMSEDATVVIKNDDAIRMRGKVEAELDSPWIQTEDMANNVGEWIKDHWGDGVDEFTVEIFGNPLIEITDVIAIEYPQKFMDSSTHRFFVTSAKTEFDMGVKTSLTLRRVHSA